MTLNITVQLPLAGIAIPEKLRAVWPAVKVVGVVPAQVPDTAPPCALILARVSVKAAPVSALALPFVNVRVTEEFPPVGIEAGLNALAMEGAVTTVRVAVLLTVPAAGVCVVVTPEVVFGFAPT